MNINFEFDTSIDADRHNFKVFSQAKNMFNAICDFMYRYRIDDLEGKKYEDALEDFYSDLQNHNVDIDIE